MGDPFGQVAVTISTMMKRQIKETQKKGSNSIESYLPMTSAFQVTTIASTTKAYPTEVDASKAEQTETQKINVMLYSSEDGVLKEIGKVKVNAPEEQEEKEPEDKTRAIDL